MTFEDKNGEMCKYFSKTRSRNIKGFRPFKVMSTYRLFIRSSQWLHPQIQP